MAAALLSSTVFLVEFRIYLAIWFVLLAVKLFAFVDAAYRPAAYYVASDKQTKVLWLVLLGATLMLHVISWDPGFGLFAMIGAIIAFVYLADVRPTLRSMRRR